MSRPSKCIVCRGNIAPERAFVVGRTRCITCSPECSDAYQKSPERCRLHRIRLARKRAKLEAS